MRSRISSHASVSRSWNGSDVHKHRLYRLENDCDIGMALFSTVHHLLHHLIHS